MSEHETEHEPDEGTDLTDEEREARFEAIEIDRAIRTTNATDPHQAELLDEVVRRAAEHDSTQSELLENVIRVATEADADETVRVAAARVVPDAQGPDTPDEATAVANAGSMVAAFKQAFARDPEKQAAFAAAMRAASERRMAEAVAAAEDPEKRAMLREALRRDGAADIADKVADAIAADPAKAEAFTAALKEVAKKKLSLQVVAANQARREAARALLPPKRKPGTPTAAESDAEPIPDFVIIGAQKSATRWLRLNLGLHPDVFTADVELSFFNDGPTFRLGAEWYAEQFLGWEGQPITGEATPGYMIWRHDPSLVAKRIESFKPEMKLIAVLRNPIDRAYSGLVHHLRRGRLPADTDLLDFVRAQDPLDDRMCIITGGWYAASLAPFKERFGDQLLIMLHDDIKATPDVVYETAVGHIGATPGFLPDELAAVRFGNTPPKESGLRRQQGEGYRQLTVAQRWALWDYFAEDIAKLEEMTGRDLSMWRPAKPPA